MNDSHNSQAEKLRLSRLVREDLNDPPVAAEHLPPSLESTGDSLSAASYSAHKLKPTDFPHYEDLLELGRGGMGVVYRARHKTLKRNVALKVVLSGLHSGDRERERFRLEAESIARLQHSGIVQIFEVGEHEGTPFLALELVEGGSLEDQTGQPHSPIWSAAIVLQVAQAVAFAHQNGIVHRDLKPANILLTGQTTNGSGSQWHSPAVDVPRTKITDFGLAKQLDSNSNLTQSGALLGTPAYMAPEQVDSEAEAVGPQADIYSLGAILYELLTGRPPFIDEHLAALFLAIVEREPDSPRTLAKDIPRDLETICLKCLQKNPANRYATAVDLARDLERFLHGEPILAKPLSALGKLLRWGQQKPALAGIYLSGLCLYTLHLIMLYGFQSEKNGGAFHLALTGITAGTCLAATFAQKLLESPKWRKLGSYLMFSCLPALAVFSSLTLDQGPQSAPLPITLLLILVAALFSPRPAMVWFTTCLCICGFSWLTLYSYWLAPQTQIPLESTMAFYLALGLTGVFVHLLLGKRRAEIVAAHRDSGGK